MKVMVKSFFSLCVLGGVFCISAAYSAPAQVQESQGRPVGLGPRGPGLNRPTTQRPSLDNRQQGEIPDRLQVQLDTQVRISPIRFLTPVSRSSSLDGALTSSAMFRLRNGVDVAASLTTGQAGESRFAIDSAAESLAVVDIAGMVGVEGVDFVNGIQYSARLVSPGVFAINARQGSKLIQGTLFSTSEGWIFQDISGMRFQSDGNQVIVSQADGSFRNFSMDEISQLGGLGGTSLAATSKDADAMLNALGGSPSVVSSARAPLVLLLVIVAVVKSGVM